MSSATLVWPADLVLADSGESKPLDGLLPEYPWRMEADDRSARLVAVYVVDTTGRVDIASVRFLLDAPRPFATAICNVLRKNRFAPLRRNGQLHPALMLTPYVFATGDGSGDAQSAHELPNVEALREVMTRTGLPNARTQLESRPRCG